MPRRRKVVESKELVRAVLREVAARGPAKVSMDVVARELRISVATLIRRHPTRTALLEATYEAFHQQIFDHIDAAYYEYPEAEPFQVIWRILTKLLVYDESGRAFMALYLERASFLPPEKLDEVVPSSLAWWLRANARDLGPAGQLLQARIVWGFLFALLLARGSQLDRDPSLARKLGEACWAALRHGAGPQTSYRAVS